MGLRARKRFGQNFLADPGIVVPYGCDAMAVASLTLLEGAPTPGDTMTFGVDDPTGALTPGAALSFVAVAQQPDPGYPCGTPMIGWSPNGATAELLVPLQSPMLLGPILTGPAWQGVGQPSAVPLELPLVCSLIGNVLYAQGVLVDPAYPGGATIALTNGLELRFGS